MRITADNADADCRIGEPAPRNADTVWHYDLEQIPGGRRCLECGEVFRNKPTRRKKATPAPQSNAVPPPPPVSPALDEVRRAVIEECIETIYTFIDRDKDGLVIPYIATAIRALAGGAE